MEIQLERIKLRPWRMNDITSLMRYADNINVAMNMRDGFPHPYSKVAGEKWLNAAVSDNLNWFLSIEFAGEAIGGAGLFFMDDVYRFNAELGYWLAEPFWNRGIATEAVTAIVKQAFEITQ